MTHGKRHYLYIAFCLSVSWVGIAFISCSQSPRRHPPLQSRIDETDTYIEVTGLGAAAADGKTTEAEAKRNAEIIANIQAVELLAEAIQGVAVRGEMRLRDLRIHEGELTQLIKVRLKNVRQVGSTRFERQEDGSWLAAYTIQYEREDAKSLAAELSSSNRTGNLSDTGMGKDTPEHYSGIILDLRYLFGYTSLTAPKVAAYDGTELFTVRHIDPDILSSHYGVPIFSTIGEAVTFGDVGTLPLKMVPTKYESGTDTVFLSAKDTRKLLNTVNREILIRRGKIVLIL